MNEQVLLDIRGAIATLTLNRPQAMNSLGLEMGRAFLARVEELQQAAGVKVVVVTGAGDHFMAGGDIKEFHTMVAETPAERTSCPPLPFFISRLWMVVPAGMNPSGRQLPGRMSAFRLDTTVSPCFRPSGAEM